MNGRNNADRVAGLGQLEHLRRRILWRQIVEKLNAKFEHAIGYPLRRRSQSLSEIEVELPRWLMQQEAETIFGFCSSDPAVDCPQSVEPDFLGRFLHALHGRLSDVAAAADHSICS